MVTELVDPPEGDELKNLLEFDRDELVAELESSLALESFRARQLVSWLYRRGAHSFDEMTDISKETRSALQRKYYIYRPGKKQVQKSKDKTRKYLFAMADGNCVESVYISQPTRYTLCISSQVGCAIGCKFCRTAQMGLVRNLKTSEIIGQVLAVEDDLREAVSQGEEAPDFENIVFMGMGEPLHNLENVIRAVKILNDDLGFDFSARKITVSTSGLVPAIKKFGESGARANLAVSLNATTDEVRSAIMPLNRKYPLAVLLQTLRDYPLKKGRRITIEYVLIKGINDTDEDLKRLPHILHGVKAKVNLIPYNGNTGLGFETPDADRVLYWQERLLAASVSSSIRWSKGEDISAACGQLATEATRAKK